MDLKHLLSLYIAELEAAGDQSREELLNENPDLSGELNRFFQFMDQAKSQLTDETVDISSKAESDSGFEAGATAYHPSSSEPAAAAAKSDQPVTEDVPLKRKTGSVTIGNYKLLQKIAEGGMGAVWLAEQLRPVRRRVALKLIKAGRDTDQIIARFDAERQALAMMEHQNIAKMLDAGQTEDGMPFFVMELVQGLPITQYCDRNRLTPQERLQLFIPVCRAIQHAHQKGIIHRDLKPSNVLVTLNDSKAVPKVIDFGLAKATEHQTRLTDKTMFTEFGQVVGTLQYMSPEQAELNSIDVDTRTDIYALGVLLYELLTGSTPLEHSSFVNVSILKVLETIRTQEPPRPSMRLSGSGEAVVGISQQRRIAPDKLQGILKGDLDWVVMKALEKDRTRRYETASAFADDIQRYLNNEPLHARPPSALYLTQKFMRKHRPAVIAAGCMLGLLVFGLTGTAIGLSQALSAKALETQARRVAESNLDRAVQAEAAERQRGTELQRRSEELEKLTQFQQNQIRAIEPFKMGRDLRARLIKDLTEKSVDGNPLNAEPGKPVIDLVSSGVNFTDVATETLRSNIFQPAFETIKNEYADQPVFQAKMLLTLATSMRNTGILDPAPIELCVAIREQHLGPDSEDTIDAKLELAHLRSDKGELKDSLELYQEALADCRRVWGNHHRLTQNSMGAYASALHVLGRFEEAVALHQENLQLRKKRGADSLEVARSMCDLASALARLQRLTEAEELYRQALAMQTAKHGEKDRDVLSYKMSLGKTLYEQGKYDLALELDEEVIAGYREMLGELHPHTLFAKNNHAANYFGLGRIEEALALYRTVLSQLRETLGPYHPNTLMTAGNTALCLSKLGKFEESEALFKETIERQDRTLGASHPQSLKTVCELGSLYSDNKRLEAATPWFRRYFDATKDHNVGCVLIRCLLRQDKDDEARQLSAEMLVCEKERYKDSPNELAIALGEIAQSFYVCERFYAARPILVEAQRLFIETKDRTSDAAVDVETMLSIFN